MAYVPLTEDSLFLSESILSSIFNLGANEADKSIDQANIELSDSKIGAMELILGNLGSSESLIIEILTEPLEIVFEAIENVLSEVTTNINGIFDIVSGDLSGVTSTLNTLSSIIFGEGETFLETIFDSGAIKLGEMLGEIDITFESLTDGLIGSVGTLLSSMNTTLALLPSEITDKIGDSLDSAFDILGDALGEIKGHISAIIDPLVEEFSSVVQSITQLGSDLVSSVKGMLDIDIDELASISILMNKKMLELRAEELLK